jgi:hypothetical protein
MPASTATVPTITIPLTRGAETAKTIKATADPALLWLDKAVLEAIGASDFADLTITITATKFDGEVNELGVAVTGLPEPESTPESEAPADEPKAEPEPKRRTRAKAA